MKDRESVGGKHNLAVMEHETKQKIAKRNDSEGGLMNNGLRAWPDEGVQEAPHNHHDDAFTGDKAPAHVGRPRVPEMRPTGSWFGGTNQSTKLRPCNCFRTQSEVV